MLPVDADEEMAHLAQLIERRWGAVDEGLGAPLPAYLAAEYALSAVIERVLLKPFPRGGVLRGGEHRGYLGAILPGTHLRRLGPGPEAEPQGVDGH